MDRTDRRSIPARLAAIDRAVGRSPDVISFAQTAARNQRTTSTSERPVVVRIAAVASGALSLTILVAGVAFALSKASALVDTPTALVRIQVGQGWWLAAHVGYLVIAALFPLTLPGLRTLAGAPGRAYVEIGTSLGIAAIGPVVVAAVVALAFIPLGTEYVTGRAPETALVVAGALQVVVRFAFITMGILVGGSVASLGLALRHGGHRRLGMLGVAAGALFATGTLGPAVLPVFVFANVLGIVWFAGVGSGLREHGAAAT